MVAPNDAPIAETAAEQQGGETVTEKVVKPVVEEKAETSVEKEAVVEKETVAVKDIAEGTTDEVVDLPELDDAALMAKAKGLLAEGKVAYAKLAFEPAQDKLSECCQIIGTVEGDKSAALYMPMLFLAKTLLDLSRMEQPVVENALTGVEDTADDSTVEEDKEKTENKIDTDVVDEAKADEVADKVIEALDENAAEADAAKSGEAPVKTKGEQESVQTDEEAKVDDVIEEAKDVKTSEEEVVTAEGDVEMPEEDGSESTATDDIPNIQLAYENAATARLIADAQLEKATTDETKAEWKANVAEALLVLGEVCIADEQFENAVIELTACEKVQQEIWSSSDRRLADTYFQFGRAFTNLGRFTEAGDVYGKALKVITLLKEETSSKQSSEEDETKKKELSEEVIKLETLLKDIESWVKDSIDSHKSRVQAEEANKEDEASGSAVGTVTEEGETAKDISGLVRKRKADVVEATEEKKEATTVATVSPSSKENDVGPDADAAVVAKKARLSSEEVSKTETAAQ